MSAICFALGLIVIFAAFAGYWPVQSGSRSFLGVASGRCDLPCGTTYDYICCFSCFFASARRVTPLSYDPLERYDLPCARTYNYTCWFCCFFAGARRVALLSWGHLEKVGPALRKAGRAFPQVGKFSQVSQDFSGCRTKI